jgi:hypothetical protein
MTRAVWLMMPPLDLLALSQVFTGAAPGPDVAASGRLRAPVVDRIVEVQIGACM